MDAFSLSKEFANSILPVTVFIGVLALCGLFGNASVTFVYKWRYSPCNFRTFVLCLAMIDFTSCIFVFPSEMYGHRIWFSYQQSSAWFCKLKTSVYAVAVFFSSYILLLISIDRYRKVCRPLGWQIKQNVAFRLCLFILGLSMILVIPCPILFGIQTANISYAGEQIEIASCQRDDLYKDSIWITIYVVVLYYTSVVTFMITTMVLYGMILRRLFCGQFLKDIDHTDELKRKNRLQEAELSGDEDKDCVFTSDTFHDFTNISDVVHRNSSEPKLTKIRSADCLYVVDAAKEERTSCHQTDDQKQGGNIATSSETENRIVQTSPLQSCLSDSGIEMKKSEAVTKDSMIESDQKKSSSREPCTSRHGAEIELQESFLLESSKNIATYFNTDHVQNDEQQKKAKQLNSSGVNTCYIKTQPSNTRSEDTDEKVNGLATVLRHGMINSPVLNSDVNSLHSEIAGRMEVQILNLPNDSMKITDTGCIDDIKNDPITAEYAKTAYIDENNGKTMHISRKHMHNKPKYTRSRQRIRNKSLIMFVVTLIFNITTLLYFCIFTIVMRREHIFEVVTTKTAGILFFFWRLYFINHVINPVVYGFMDPRFRQIVKKFWRRLRWRQSKHNIR